MKTYSIFIDNAWEESDSGQFFDSIDPWTGQPWARIPSCQKSDVDRAVQAAKRAFDKGEWATMNATRRGHLLRRLGDLLAASSDSLARTEAKDNGKRLVEAIPQFKYLPEWLYYYAGLADKIEGAVIPVDTPNIFNYTRHEPLGVVAAITPWNSPVMLMLWKLAPALAAGNTLVIKPSEQASASTVEFMHLVKQAGFPAGVVNVVTGFANTVGAPLVAHPDVTKVTFTGSVSGGKAVNRSAADQLKKVTLELGGKSPQIVFDDARLDNTVNGILSGIFLSNGQTCVAGSRLLVHESLTEPLAARLEDAISKLTMGDPSDPNTDVGPIANQAQFESILKHLCTAKEEGATMYTGGCRSSRPGCENGWFIEPTVLTDVTPDMQIANKEVFGPVTVILPFRDEAEAIDLANRSHFGLAAGIWTEDSRRAHRVTNLLKCGTVYVNTYRSVSMMSPAGGYKMSGFGRENGQDMIREYMQTKSVWINNGETVANPFSQEITIK